MTDRHALQLLHVEDNPADADYTRELLSEVPGHTFVIRHVSLLKEALALLERSPVDAIVLDLNLPDSRGTATLRRLRETAVSNPIVVLAGVADEKIRLEVLREGAQDVINKNEAVSSLLARSVLYAIERHHAQERSRQVEALVRASPDAVVVADSRGVVRFANAAADTFFGPAPERLIDRSLPFSTGEGLPAEIEIEMGGERRIGEIRGAQFSWEGESAQLVSIRDVTAERRMREELDAARNRLLHVLETSQTIVYSAGVGPGAFELTWISDNVQPLLGCSPDEALAPGWWQGRVHADHLERVLKQIDEERRRDSYALEYRFRHGDGSYRWISSRSTLVRDEGGKPYEIIGTWIDSTERKQLESQLHQSQKMEAVGRLAGGVAHDFNNALTVILGNGELLQDTLSPHDPRRENTDMVLRACEQAAGLTRQLLAFSRQHVLEARPTDVNAVVSGVEKMLRRVLGEDIAIGVQLAPEPAVVVVDPGQLEQVLMNLVLNARDAMPDGGSLSLETSFFDLDAPLPPGHGPSEAGSYVLLSVTDTGTGMDEATQGQIFEPFFTTKEPGKGTGLGLASVYGIVQQSGGHVWVYSEPGRGSTFKVCLPRTAMTVVSAAPRKRQDAPRGTETILLIEDDEPLRRLASSILQRQGYVVLDARDGEEALRLATTTERKIHLVISDVVMPGMGGPAVVERLRQLFPDLRVLFTSGYPADSAFRHTVHEAGLAFLQKPFTLTSIANKVREVLG